ncbi:MAG: hypothetical protein KDD25_09450, partial [Bdellovibrionales bacterium]|nr:hypothetical protein [Bdellovibrionales bacterium]
DLMASESMSLLERDLQSRISGLAYGLGQTILMLVSQNNFDLAIKELEGLKKTHSKLPILYKKSGRYIDHCVELVSAIKMKKSFPNLRLLPVSKQEEMRDRVIYHFEDLKRSLKQIEKLEASIRLSDSRSTLWVIRSFAISVFAVVAWAIAIEAYRSMGKPSQVLMEDLTKLFFEVFGL